MPRRRSCNSRTLGSGQVSEYGTTCSGLGFLRGIARFQTTANTRTGVRNRQGPFRLSAITGTTSNAPIFLNPLARRFRHRPRLPPIAAIHRHPDLHAAIHQLGLPKIISSLTILSGTNSICFGFPLYARLDSPEQLLYSVTSPTEFRKRRTFLPAARCQVFVEAMASSRLSVRNNGNTSCSQEGLQRKFDSVHVHEVDRAFERFVGYKEVQRP